MMRMLLGGSIAMLLGGAGAGSALAASTGSPAAGPLITSISPNNGPRAGGSAIAITGERFSASTRVLFDGVQVTGVTVDSPTSITVLSPPGSGAASLSVTDAAGASPSTPYDMFEYDAPPSSPWLGLNGNSSDPAEEVGAVDEFAAQRIVYDRGNGIDWVAGGLPSERRWRAALASSVRAGMVPIITIEFAAYAENRCTWGHDCLPTGRAATEYIEGFDRSAEAIVAKYPRTPILFEVMNEPYGYGTAAQYASIVARLLPAAARDGIPADRIYVAATGRHWIADMYAARSVLRTAIAGWYVHPYGPAKGSRDEYSAGIQSLPYLQAEMTSGQSNIIVSEVGYCTHDSQRGQECPRGAFTAQSAGQASDLLIEALSAAALYHEEGWLRALLVYGRGPYQGWGMQFPGGTLTAQGEAFQAFADLFG
jgi:IPT/TIG domain